MADFRAKRVSVLEGLLLLTHATGLAAREQGRWSGYAGLSAGQGTGGGRLTLGSRGVKGPRSRRSVDGAGEAGADFSGSGVLCAAPGLGQRSKVQATEQGRPLRPVALGPLDVYVRKANLGPDLAAFTKSAPMGRAWT